ncbi:MAG: DNA glycosylase [Halobacteria archaeon]|nr:DNA glycosylase [Halobacteria archaeon]
MEGPIQEGRLRTEIDIESTFECGQIYHWWPTNEGYATSIDNELIEFQEWGEGIKYRTTGVNEARIKEFLGLNDPLEEIYAEITKDDLTRKAVQECQGLRIIRDDFFACTISFIASTQSTVSRTTGMIRRLCEEYGETKEGYASYTFPDHRTLAQTSEEELREVGLGYRAPYVRRTSEMIENKEINDETREMSYYEAHDELKRLAGVGDKVADCVLLFSLGFLNVVALDTWLNRVIDTHYPDLRGETYRETADNFREKFSPYAGYAQTYLYHYMRSL